MVEKMKKIVSLLLSLILIFALAVPALATDNVVTTTDIERAIANGEATAVNEIRDIDSFTQEEIAADEALQYIFENGGISAYGSNTNSREGKVTKSTRVKAGDNVRAVSAEWNDFTTLNSSDHDLTINGQISTYNSNLTANKTANAVAKWKYNVYYGALTPNPHESDVRLQVSTTYLVNVK